MASSPTFGMSQRDLFLAELGVARRALELLDVDRGVDVVFDHRLADEDRVFEVVATPGHERDDHVAAERELAVLGAGAVGHHIARLTPGRPCFTIGFWLMQVFWLERWYFIKL
jgi:hypothetical protein